VRRMTTAPQRAAFLSPAQVAELVGLSEKTVRRHIHAGLLRASRIGTRLVIAYDDVSKWIEAARVTQTAEHRAPASPPLAPPIRGSLAVLRAIEEGA
jgi:excisionase family DNA binding protein